MSEFCRLIDVDKYSKELETNLEYYKRKSARLHQENKQLKDVIEEVREYAKNDMYYTLSDGNTSVYVIEKAEKELLQILDKIGSDKEWVNKI